MDKIKIIREAQVSVVDEETGIRLNFTEGEPLSGYTASLSIPDPELLRTEEGVARVSAISEKLREYAAQHFPQEFMEIKTGEENE